MTYEFSLYKQLYIRIGSKFKECCRPANLYLWNEVLLTTTEDIPCHLTTDQTHTQIKTGFTQLLDSSNAFIRPLAKVMVASGVPSCRWQRLS